MNKTEISFINFICNQGVDEIELFYNKFKATKLNECIGAIQEGFIQISVLNHE